MFGRCKYSVCRECQVHFEPVQPSTHEAKWGHLCPTHRKPVMLIAARFDKVMAWARDHWEKLEVQVLEQERKEREAQNEAIQGLMNAQQSHLAQQMAGGLQPLRAPRG